MITEKIPMQHLGSVTSDCCMSGWVVFQMGLGRQLLRACWSFQCVCVLLVLCLLGGHYYTPPTCGYPVSENSPLVRLYCPSTVMNSF